MPKLFKVCIIVATYLFPDSESFLVKTSWNRGSSDSPEFQNGCWCWRDNGRREHGVWKMPFFICFDPCAKKWEKENYFIFKKRKKAPKSHWYLTKTRMTNAKVILVISNHYFWHFCMHFKSLFSINMLLSVHALHIPLCTYPCTMSELRKNNGFPWATKMQKSKCLA